MPDPIHCRTAAPTKGAFLTNQPAAVDYLRDRDVRDRASPRMWINRLLPVLIVGHAGRDTVWEAAWWRLLTLTQAAQGINCHLVTGHSASTS